MVIIARVDSKVFDRIISFLSKNSRHEDLETEGDDNKQSNRVPCFDELQQNILIEMEKDSMSSSDFVEVIEDYEGDLNYSELESIEKLAEFLDYTGRNTIEGLNMGETDLEGLELSFEDLSKMTLNYVIVEEIETNAEHNWGRTTGRACYELGSDSLNDNSQFLVVDTSSIKEEDTSALYFTYAAPVSSADYLMDEKLLE